MDVQVVEHTAGLTWFVADETMQRACHAIRDGERIWLVDPIDDASALERATGLGEIAGVLQLLDRHERDGALLARRLGVSLRRLPDTPPTGSAFEILRPVDVPRWRERALWDPARGLLVVAEVLGTNGYFRLGDAAVGVHPFVRPFGVPAALRGRDVRLLLCGHGPPLEGPRVGAEIEAAAEAARRDLLRLPGTLLLRR